MAKIYGAQRKLGYHDIVYNIKTGKFFVPMPGDNYYELDVQTGGGSGDGTEGTQTTATLPLANPTRLGRADSSGLKTQSDFNNYIDAYVKEVEGEAGNHFSGDYNDLSNKPSIPTDNAELTNGAGYITLSEVPDPVLEGALVFKGSVANEGALPGDASVGEIYFNEEDSHMYAWGDDGQWHKLNTVDDVNLDGYATEEWVEGKSYITAADLPDAFSGDYNDLTNQPTIPTDNAQLANGAGYITAGDIPEVNLDPYAKLNDSAQSITAKEFIGDGSKLTNLPGGDVDLSEYARLDGAEFTGDCSVNGEINVDKLSLGDQDSAWKASHTYRGWSYEYELWRSADGDGGDARADTKAAKIRSYLEANVGRLVISDGSADFDLYALTRTVTAKEFSITAKEFIGDGSKLTNLPGGGSISEVLAEGNTADPGQSLHFKITEGDLPPITSDSIDIEGSAGLRLGGVVSYYHIKEPFTVDTGSGDVSDFQFATRQISAFEDAFRSENDRGDVFNKVGLNGYKFRNSGTFTEINERGISTWVEDKDDPDNKIFDIKVSPSSGTSSIKAGEFIGDGSKLTGVGLPDFRTLTPLS